MMATLSKRRLKESEAPDPVHRILRHMDDRLTMTSDFDPSVCQVGDIVRSRGRKNDSKTVYQLLSRRPHPQGMVLTLPDGMADLQRSSYGTKYENLEHVPLNEIPVHVLADVDLPPADEERVTEVLVEGGGSMTMKEAGYLLCEKPDQVFTAGRPFVRGERVEAVDPFMQMDRLALRKACMRHTKMNLSQTSPLTDDAMRTLLKGKGFTPPPVAPQRKIRSTTARTKLEGEVLTLGWPEAYVKELKVKELLALAQEGKNHVDTPAEKALIVLGRDLEGERRAREDLGHEVKLLEQERRVGVKDAQAAKLQKDSLSGENARLRTSHQTVLRREENLQNRLDELKRTVIERTEENVEALEIGREILERRKEVANDESEIGSRFKRVKNATD
jgi:hypothetical protein